MRIILLVALFLSAFNSNAQHPAYYMFGEEQFKGIDIYDMIQDDENNYWFATSQGLYIHNGYTYESVECPEMKGASVFGFQKDSQGTIYCLNLQHQIFRIIKGKMMLYYELPVESQSPDISLALDPKDNLLIQSATVTIIAPNKSTITRLESKLIGGTRSAHSIHSIPDGSAISSMTIPVILHTVNGKLKYLDSAFSELNIYYENDQSINIYWTVLEDQVIGIDPILSKAYEFDLKSRKVHLLKDLDTKFSGSIVRLYTSENRLWMAGNSNGVYAFDQNLNPLFKGEVIYSDYFISDIFTDHENNVLLSTFDEGVIVIPNNSVFGMTLPDQEKITRLKTCDDGILIGSNIGTIYQYNSLTGLKKIDTNPNFNAVEPLFYWQSRKSFIRNLEGVIQLYDLETNTSRSYHTGSLKDISFIDNENFLLALNHNLILWRIDSISGKLIHTKSLFDGRTYSTCYNPQNKSVYVGTSSGLRIINAEGKQKSVELGGTTVYANTIISSNDQIVAGTRKHGILIYSNDKIIRTLPFKESIRKIVVHGQKLFVLSRSGLYLGDLNSDKFIKLNQSIGLEFENIVDFTITNEILHITNSTKIQYIDLKNLFNHDKAIPIRFSSILVNGKNAESSNYGHDQSNFIFEFCVSTLRYRENVKYAYKLIGHENKWQELSYKDNSVEYSALPPGRYTFIVKSINGTAESKAIEYSFTIDAPYYQKWWFFALIILFSGLGITLIFTYRIRKIRKKNRERLKNQKMQTELLETELKALRSQMNPHFIFNSLNSIQDLILKEDTDASYDYIVLFADLVRSTLNYSNKDFIPIEKELEFLDVYLSLEKLRFKDDFTYNINFDGAEEIDVPSMLIQPFIENALLHGLLHKNGKKHLEIRFEYKDKLICTIEDNGIGRKKASKISNRQGDQHESFALEAIDNRLRIFNERSGEQIGKYTIEDLNPELEETGTKVIIHLPFRRQF